MVVLDHAVIAVSDWAESNAFYRDVLGAELVETDGGFVYRGEYQLNVHGPGGRPFPVAGVPVRPGGSDLCFFWMGRSPARSSICAPRRSNRGRPGGVCRRPRRGGERLLPRPGRLT